MPPEFRLNPRFASSKSLRVGIVCGGVSAERKISLKSGRGVRKALQAAGFDVVMLDPRDKHVFLAKLKKIDVVFLALHGVGGEDGSIQRFLSQSKIPFTGSGRLASEKSFDKAKTKRILVRSAIPTARYLIVNRRSWKRTLKRFPLPFFLKPVSEGSSIGAFAVEDLAKSAVKIETAIDRYGVLMAEVKLTGREFTVGILGRKALPVVELRPKRSFYDYRAKYTKGMTEYLVPAPIPRKLSQLLQRMAVRTHEVLGLRDLSRVDIMTDGSGRPFVLEANSIPGFTEFSLFPKAAKAAGISFDKLCARLVHWAWSRSHKHRSF